MTQFGFFGTWDDSWRMLAAVLEHPEFCIFPDSRYSDPMAFKGVTVDDKLKVLCADRGVAYIWSSLFSITPPLMVRIEGGKNAGKYFIDPSYGGPGLVFHLPGCYEKDNRVQLAPGSLWHPKKTFNSQTQLWMPPTLKLKTGFRVVRNIIMQQLVEHKIGLSSILIGINAKRVIDDGRADLHGIEM